MFSFAVWGKMGDEKLQWMLKPRPLLNNTNQSNDDEITFLPFDKKEHMSEAVAENKMASGG